MSKHGAWSVIFEDKEICKMSGEFGIKDGMNYEFEEQEHDDFWNQDMFDARHLLGLQGEWDNNNLYDDDGNVIAETTEQKVARIGPRPTSYSSY